MAALYDSIGHGYDKTRRADPFLVGRLIHHLGIPPGSTAHWLDVACGTGNYTLALSARGGRWWGIDESWWMLRQARRKSDAIAWIRGDATATPFNRRAFAGTICVLAIHHFVELDPLFAEIRRLTGDGRLVIFTATKQQMERFWLNHYFPVAMERTIDHRLAEQNLTGVLRRTGWQIRCLEPYDVRPDLADGFLYSGKQRPRLYLCANARQGMSTFATLADPEEVEIGCQRLEADIRSGRIDQVIARYVGHGKGDYLFVVAEPA